VTTSNPVIAASLPAQQTRNPWLVQHWALLGLGLVVLIAAALRLYDLSAIGDANTYYTAAVDAMLQSPSNFFFVAAEPGGSVTVDKPPLGLWVQALFAAIFGVSGVVVALPQAIAGILSVVVLFHLVRKYWGAGAGLIAALVLAISPVSVAVERNNTIDGQLIFVLLLAAWAFMRATETGKTRWLIVGAVLVGLGFNIKMLQAFLPLPAFYGLYLLGADLPWGRKTRHLLAATVVLLIVSTAWAIVVDLTPADQRPYIGSSSNNTVLDLIVGYNGLGRLLGIDSSGVATQAQGMMPGGMGAGGFGDETGEAGFTRLFESALGNEIAWLLIFALLGVGVMVARERVRLPLRAGHQAVVLWGGWLIIGGLFLSFSGFSHAYYTAMLAPPVAALVGITVGVLWQKRLSLLALMAAVTVGFQVALADDYTPVTWLPMLIALMAAGVFGLALARVQPHQSRGWSLIAGGAQVAAMLITPAYWSAQTLLNPSPMSNVLPGAWSGENSGGGMRALGMNGMSSVDAELTAYLEANTEGMRWMMAVSSAMDGSGYVLETGRGVLLLGGFSGGDQVATPEQIAQYVAAGDLRYVLDSGQLSMTQPEVAGWVQANCQAAEDIEIRSPMGDFDPESLNPAMLESMGIELPESGFPDLGEAGVPGAGPGAGPGGMQGMFGRMPQPALYDCAANES